MISAAADIPSIVATMISRFARVMSMAAPIGVWSDDPEQAACSRHETDIGLGPMPARDQKDVDERAKKIADVGGQKIEGVERE